MATRITASRLTERWPTLLGLATAGVCAVIILGLDVDDLSEDFAPGIATMMGIYLAAYAIGKPGSAWLAFVVLVAVAAVVGGPSSVDTGVVMTAILALLWLWALARGRASDGWFTLESLGLVLFGGLTLGATLVDARTAGILAGVGWLTHGLWDSYHFAKDRVVSRSWSEMCAVVDIPVGTLLIAVSIIRT